MVETKIPVAMNSGFFYEICVKSINQSIETGQNGCLEVVSQMWRPHGLRLACLNEFELYLRFIYRFRRDFDHQSWATSSSLLY
jgi:hypothetical protein